MVSIMFREEAKFYRKVIAPEFAKIREEIADFRTDVKNEFKEVRNEMATKAELDTFKIETERNFEDLRGEIGIVKGNHERRIRRVETKLKLSHTVAVD